VSQKIVQVQEIAQPETNFFVEEMDGAMQDHIRGAKHLKS